MSAETRKRCLAEEWFIDDSLSAMAKLCVPCRSEIEFWLRFFGADNEAALSEIYRQSRSIRTHHVMAGNFKFAKRTSDWAALEMMMTIGTMVRMAALMWMEKKI